MIVSQGDNRVLKCRKQKLTELQGEPDYSVINEDWRCQYSTYQKAGD